MHPGIAAGWTDMTGVSALPCGYPASKSEQRPKGARLKRMHFLIRLFICYQLEPFWSGCVVIVANCKQIHSPSRRCNKQCNNVINGFWLSKPNQAFPIEEYTQRQIWSWRKNGYISVNPSILTIRAPHLEAGVGDGGPLEANWANAFLGQRVVVNELTNVQVWHAH